MILQKARQLLQKANVDVETAAPAIHQEAQLDQYTQSMYENNPTKAKDALDWQQRFPGQQVIGMAGHLPIFLTGGADIEHGESGLHGGYTKAHHHELAAREINHRLEHIQKWHQQQLAQNPKHIPDQNTFDEIDMLQGQKTAHTHMANKMSGKIY